MAQSAYIHFVEGSAVASMTMDELKQQLLQFKEQLERTGKQLGWDYAEAGFPYTIETKPDSGGRWFYLKGTNSLYKYIVLGMADSQAAEGTGAREIQVVLPDGCTHGDKSKGNELCKYLARKNKAELKLFLTAGRCISTRGNKKSLPYEGRLFSCFIDSRR